MKSPSILALCLYACLVFANLCESSSFKPNCTLPTSGANYVAGSNTRSTLAIVWNCASVILLCTWNIQHLNVPAIRPGSGIKKLWITITTLGTKIKWMVLTIFIPEYFVGKAMSELFAAQSAYHHMKSEGYEEWGIVHSYLANMGYFVLDTQQLNITVPPAAVTSAGQRYDSMSTSRASIKGREMPPSQDYKRESLLLDAPHSNGSPHEAQVKKALENPLLSSSAKINAHRLKYRYWALTFSQWQYLFDEGVAAVPNTPSIYLERLNKGGTLIKLLAVGQVSYLIVQLISRKIQDIPSSQLEIGTLAFSVSSIITYGLYWKQPQGVETIHIIPATNRELDIEAIVALAAAGPRYLSHKLRTKNDFDTSLGPSPIPNDGSHAIIWLSELLPRLLPERLTPFIQENQDLIIWTLGTVFSGIPFGGLHCLAWNFEFPTRVEVVIWRVCSVATACLPLVAMVPILLWIKHIEPMIPHQSEIREGLDIEDPDFLGMLAYIKASRLPSRWAVACIVLTLTLLYFLGRLFLLCEMIRCLFYLPPEAFIDTWSNAFPHWG
ncbi:hypothetical protein F4805DRAFT_455946 [Annulohypoxylon moriforme]|nr:hypothetical protein F4805DRAFT_455946 [Annulohypoxylon moriforme]